MIAQSNRELVALKGVERYFFRFKKNTGRVLNDKVRKIKQIQKQQIKLQLKNPSQRKEINKDYRKRKRYKGNW